MQSDVLHLLKKVTDALEARNIAFMVSGSIAMNIYATPRMTRDIDVVIGLFLDNLDAFLEIFKSGFYIYEPTVRDEVKRRGMFNVIDHETGYKIDFMLLKTFDEYRQMEFSRRKKQHINGFETWVVSMEDLLISKLIWIQDLQSDRQKEDIKNLLDNPALDMEYARHWIKTLNLNTFRLL